MKIGELSTTTGVPIDTIRHYEREGLLPAPARSESNYRHYSPEHAQRLSFIRHCRGLDMALDEIRVLLRFKDAPSAECGEVNALLDEHIGHVAQRVRELRALEKQLRELRELRETCRSVQDAGHCGILNQLDTLASSGLPLPVTAGHVHGVHSSGPPRTPTARKP
jgi:Cd(II)/Pb(II)-responsive transcriptional regulator